MRKSLSRAELSGAGVEFAEFFVRVRWDIDCGKARYLHAAATA